MNFLEKEEYNIDDITALIKNEAEESVHLDFKAAGALSKDDKKKVEIAKDVSAFANSDGGIIIYGIEEQNHKAAKLSYIDGNKYTKEWLEQVIQDNVQRRIEGLKIFPIREKGDIANSIYVVKIPRSSNTPHMSADKCYYKRNNFRSVKMEEYEVRDLFYRESTPNLKISGYNFYQKETVNDYTQILGIIAVRDTVKDDSAAAVAELKRMNIKVTMLTGDNGFAARAVAEEVGIENVISDVLPTEKGEAVRSLQDGSTVMMVGDGINDAPALATAHVGVAIGAGTDVAIDSADVVLKDGSLGAAVSAVKLGRSVLRNVKENLFFAFCYNIIGIPLAAGAFIHALGWELSPMFGASAMSVSSFLVVTNALRLNFITKKLRKDATSKR